jgi:hypothetical protein
VFVVVFGAAYWTDRSGVAAATLAFAVVAAFAGLTTVVGLRDRDRRDERLARELNELLELQRGLLADTAVGKPEPEVLFLRGNAGVQRARITRRRPRPLDIEQTVAHERTLALRTLPPAKTPLAGSVKIYREPTEHDRTAFREKVERYTASLGLVLEEYDTYRKERALRVRGRFRIENHGPRTAHNLTVRAYFPDAFQVVRESLERPVLPARPTFRGRRAGLAALLGGHAQPAAPPDAPTPAPDAIAPHTGGNVSPPRYRLGSSTVEVSVEKLQHSVPADMEEEACWILRLPRPGEYRITWEVVGDELAESARGELRLEVVDLFDDTPIRSVKELLSEDDVQSLDNGAEPQPDPKALPGLHRDRRFESG